MGRILLGCVAALLLAAGVGTGAAPPLPSVRIPDLDNRLVDPFLAAEGRRAMVFLFTSVDCPVSNRYAPVVQRLYETYNAQGAAFWLVYPNPSESPAAIREHLKAFGYPVHALRDPRHDLVKLAKATVTPEAAIFDRDRQLAYHGRLDDRYVSLGVERPAPTRHDLADALAAILSDRPVKEAVTQAVGCYISDFVQ